MAIKKRAVKRKVVKGKRAHDAKTGHPVTQEYAAAHKDTTVVVPVEKVLWEGHVREALINGKLILTRLSPSQPDLMIDHHVGLPRGATKVRRVALVERLTD